ncbi:MAG: hypothetical protein ACK5NN_04370 [Sphingomonadaceae bacterium]
MDNYTKSPGKGGSVKTVAWAASGAFLLGAVIAGVIAWRTDLNDSPASFLQDTTARASGLDDIRISPAPTPSTTASAARQAQKTTDAVEKVQEQQGGIDQRLAAAEQRLARLDLQSQAAAGNTARAEGLLIAFATRRAVERGAELGYLADQLRLRFGDAMPNAVRTVITNSRDPVTLDQLNVRLDGLGPEITDASSESIWMRWQRDMNSLFVVRRESGPSPQPKRRLERARMFLQSGRVDAAVAEVKELPGADQANEWITDANRYAATQHALDLIETSAVLEPRRLRDGTGNPINTETLASGVATK